jgi:4-amino-4-deoxy-L-arabinose transferase-like glycosyltransferase
LILFGWRLGGHDLWPTDEPRFGLVAREMRASGDPVLLSRNGRLYVEKPPLFFWAINVAAPLTGGVNETAARLPSLIAAILAMLVILRLGERLYDRTTGCLAAIIFATAPQILERARWASIDMTLNLFVLVAIALLLRADDGEGRGGRAPATIAWGVMGLATLAKGPVGLVLPLLAVLPGVAIRRGGRRVLRLLPLPGIALFLAVTLAWFGPFMARLGPAHALGILTHETVDRYVDAWNVRHPVWFYLWNFPAGFFPWSLFLPWVVAAACRPEPTRAWSGAHLESPGTRRAALTLGLWFAAIFLFFSFSTGKRGVYIIPLYPAAALLTARLFVRAQAGDDRCRRLLRQAGMTLAVAGTLAGAAAAILVPRRYPDLRPAALLIGIAVALGMIAAALFARRGRAIASAASIAAAMAVVMLVAAEAVFPWANRHLNLRGFAEAARGHYRDDIPLAATKEKREAWVFYGGRTVTPLDTADEVRGWFAAGGPRDLLIDDTIYDEVRATLPPEVRVEFAARVSRGTMRLLRYEPPPVAAGPS